MYLYVYIGPAIILKALGFEKNESEGKFILEGEGSLLGGAVAKLTKAHATYMTMHP
jgi:hypothetical protein